MSRRDSALYGNRPPGVRLDVWRAYGPRYPGSAIRLLAVEELQEAAAHVEAPSLACEVEGCTRHRWARAWCQKHYARWRRTGYPLGSEDPRWQAAHPRPAPLTREEILTEMRQALASLSEVAS